MEEKLAVVVLAAGKGTRMHSDLAKVLHPVAGIPMIVRLLGTVVQLSPAYCVVVVGHQAEAVKNALRDYNVDFVLQEKQLGTGHAVRCALPGVPENCRHVLVLCGDTPLVRKETLQNLYACQESAGAVLALLAAHFENPQGYGRVLMGPEGRVAGIVEEKDASAEERLTRLVNTGFYCFDRNFLFGAISAIRPENAQGEYYLTDLVAVAVARGERVACLRAESPEEVMGINTVKHLEEAGRIVVQRGAPLQFP